MDAKEILYQWFIADPINGIKWGVGFAILVIGYVITFRIDVKVSYRIGWERKRDIAIQRNHVITATLVKKWKSGEPGSYRYHAAYQYSIDGKQKEYRAYCGELDPYRTTYLYYLDNPNKVFLYEEYHRNIFWEIIFLVIDVMPWILFALAVGLLHAELPSGMV